MKYGQSPSEDHLITTYSFEDDSFGHPEHMIGGAFVAPPGFASIEEALGKLDEARMRLVDELQKRDTGQPFDFRFVNGRDPVESMDGVVHVEGRLWRRRGIDTAPVGV